MNSPTRILRLQEAIAREVSVASRYFDRVILCGEWAGEAARLSDWNDCPVKDSAADPENLPDLSGDGHSCALVLLDGTAYSEKDLQGLLARLRPRLGRSSRVALVDCRGCFRRIRHLVLPAGYEMVRVRPVGHAPFAWLGLGRFLGRAVSRLPGVRWLCPARVIWLRPVVPLRQKPSLSVLIPARNERGNIENALKRLPPLAGTDVEVLFIEGHSTDGTWEEIRRVAAAYGDRYKIQCLQQAGVGKCDAVRLGLARANGELAVILDADLTVPPELLEHFYEKYCDGRGDFINGNRFACPMERGAMRPLNYLGNRFFSAALGWVLDVRLGDCLCGTKLFARRDYERFRRWREDFGDFDPFGDFELLFPAAVLGLGIVDLPVPYAARSYGSTQIRRFRDGWRLLKMTLHGWLRLKGTPA